MNSIIDKICLNYKNLLDFDIANNNKLKSIYEYDNAGCYYDVFSSWIEEINEKLNNIIAAGYPNRSVSELNLNNENEAYFATQIAIWSLISGYDVNKMKGDNPKILEAIKNIYYDGMDAKYNGIIAPVLIVLSIISLVPGIDAFTIAKNSQISVLENLLTKNGMLKDGQINPDGTITDNDKQKITSSYLYLRQMNYTKDIEWLNDYNEFNDFKSIFGFDEFIFNYNMGKYYYISTKDNIVADIEGYDFFTQTNFEIQNNSSNKNEICSFEKNGNIYYVEQVVNNGTCDINLLDKYRGQILTFNIDKIEEKFKNYSVSEPNVHSEDLTFTKGNEKAEIKIIARDININIQSENSNWSSNVFIFINLK
jgi:TQXA domain-containing protein